MPPCVGTVNGTCQGIANSNVGAGSLAGRLVAGNDTTVRGSTSTGLAPALVAKVVDALAGVRAAIDTLTSRSTANASTCERRVLASAR